jgi:hypothetical protein
MIELDKEFESAILTLGRLLNYDLEHLHPQTLDKLNALATDIHVVTRSRTKIIGKEELIARIKMKVEKQFDEIIDYANKQIEHRFRPNQEFEIMLPDVDIHWAGDEPLQTRVMKEIGKAWMIRKTDWLQAKLTLRQLKLDSIVIDPEKM